jgi:hypothetical protein
MSALTTRKPTREALVNPVETEVIVDGRRLVRGQQVSVMLSGRKTACRCTFLGWVTGPNGAEWVDVITPNDQCRTVRPEAIKTVHRKTKR